MNGGLIYRERMGDTIPEKTTSTPHKISPLMKKEESHRIRNGI